MSDAGDVLDVLGGRLRDTERIAEATFVQDELRAQSKDWSGEEEVRRWRAHRYSS